MNSGTTKRTQQIPWYAKEFPFLRATRDPPDTESLFSLTVKRYRLLSGIRISHRQEIFQEFRVQQVNHIFLCVTHVTHPYFASIFFLIFHSMVCFVWPSLMTKTKKKERRLLRRSALRPCHQPMGHQTHPEAMYRMGRGGWVAARWQRCLLMRIKSGEEERGLGGGGHGKWGYLSLRKRSDGQASFWPPQSLLSVWRV